MWILPVCLQTWFSAQASTQFPNFQWKHWNHVPNKLNQHEQWSFHPSYLLLMQGMKYYYTSYIPGFANIRIPESEPIRILIAGEEVCFSTGFLQIVKKNLGISLRRKPPQNIQVLDLFRKICRKNTWCGKISRSLSAPNAMWEGL